MNQNQTCPCSNGSWLQIKEKKYMSCTKIPAPENCKEINRTKSKKINRTLKLCTLATKLII